MNNKLQEAIRNGIKITRPNDPDMAKLVQMLKGNDNLVTPQSLYEDARNEIETRGILQEANKLRMIANKLLYIVKSETKKPTLMLNEKQKAELQKKAAELMAEANKLWQKQIR